MRILSVLMVSFLYELTDNPSLKNYFILIFLVYYGTLSLLSDAMNSQKEYFDQSQLYLIQQNVE